MLSSLSCYHPQLVGCQLWTPSRQSISALTSALLKQPSSKESLLDVMPAAPWHGLSGSPSQLNCALTPFSKPSKTKFLSYKSLPDEFIQENLWPEQIPSSLDQLKIMYGTLPRHSLIWGSLTRGSTQPSKLTSTSNAHSGCGNKQTPHLSGSNLFLPLSYVELQSQLWRTPHWTPFGPQWT